MATARPRQAAIVAAHRLGGDPDPTMRPVVKATMKRLASEYGRPKNPAGGLTSDGRRREGHGANPRGHQENRQRKGTEAQPRCVPRCTWRSCR